MKKLRIVPAYIWAFICVLMLPATFIGNDFFSRELARLPFMKVNPVYTGGDIAQTYKQDSMEISIHKPVFESLIGKSTRGFVQVKFSGVKPLPAYINSTIDYNNDGNADFTLTINTATAATEVKSLTKYVTGLDISSKVKDYWIVRVKLLNPDKIQK